jgi:transposase
MIPLHPSTCPHCALTLPPDLPDALPPIRTQVWELPPITPQVTEYQQRTVWCHRCHHFVHATLPPEVPPGVFGPRLTALIALLHGRFRLSIRETQAFLTDVAGIAASLGSIIRSCARVSTAIVPLDQAIHAQIQQQAVLHIDETSWREGPQRGWLWVAVSPVATSFRIDTRRNRQVVREIIGHEYRGVVHSDRAPAYNALPDQQRQLCWSHLLRTRQGLVDYGHAERWCAMKMVAQARHIFTAWHAYRCGLFDRVAVQQALLPVRHALHDLLAQGATSPWRKLRTVARDLQRHWDALWWFSRIEGVEPTNNAAERALRPAVLWRKSCFGTQSTAGSRFVERMLSVGTTCRQQARNFFAVLTEAIAAAWSGQPTPTLFAAP